MQEDEVIIVDGVPNYEFEAMVDRAVSYAVISLPFTVDRMRIPDETQRALNIAKGKIAEELFRYFCSQNNISPDFETCCTPFWTSDKRDFLLNGQEWDIKNNFIYHTGANHNRYTQLPALVPNRFPKDQWSKRNKPAFKNTTGIKFLFTFLQNANLLRGKRGQEFLQIYFNKEQEEFLRELYHKYKGKPQKRQPFSEDWFWKQMDERGTQQLYTVHNRPKLVITAYCDANTFETFRDTGGGAELNYKDCLEKGSWYQKTKTGSINFLNNTLWTTGINATCPVSKLPSFYSLFPQLQNGMNGASTRKL